LGGQAEGVGRVFEERIRGHLDFMNKNVLMKGSESKGRGVTNDVNLMASLGQAQRQFRGDDPTPAMGGVADNPDFHFVLVPFNSAVPPARPLRVTRRGTQSGRRFRHFVKRTYA